MLRSSIKGFKAQERATSLAVVGAASDEHDEKLSDSLDFDLSLKIKELTDECKNKCDVSRYDSFYVILCSRQRGHFFSRDVICV